MLLVFTYTGLTIVPVVLGVSIAEGILSSRQPNVKLPK